MKSESIKTLIPSALIIFGFLAIFGVSNFLENRHSVLRDGHLDEDLSLQGAKLKGFAFGFEGLLADWYWIRALQYIGAKIVNIPSGQRFSLENLKPLNPRLLYPLLDNAATLDPKFLEVYSYGALVLPAIDKEQALKLTKKGILHNPREWRLYQHLGFINWRLSKYDEAAESYEKGAMIEGAADFMKLMAARMRSEGGSRETAKQIYRQMFNESKDKNTKEYAHNRLSQLDSLDEMDAIRRALKNFEEQKSRCPQNWKEIFPLIQNVKLPNNRDFRVDEKGNIVDPMGTPYLLKNNPCDVSVDMQNTKLPTK